MAGQFDKVSNRVLTRIQVERDGDYIASFTDRRVLDVFFDENQSKPEIDEDAFYVGMIFSFEGTTYEVTDVTVFFTRRGLQDKIHGINGYLRGEESPSNLDIRVFVKRVQTSKK